MSGGLIQLVAYGYDSVYLTSDPQITFFKILYRRHTNFSTEQIPQYFLNPPDFGKKSTCIIPPNVADLMGKSYLVVKLPQVREFTDELTKFAWVKRVGFSMIKSIEIEINGRVIDRHYGEWLNIWAELTGEINGNHEIGLKKMVGDVSEMTEFTNGKEEYTLYIPLQFWFCRSAGLALPMVSLQYSDVKMNVEFEEAEKCYITTPTHYIKCRDDIVNFKPYEYIEQNIDGDIRAGIFTSYDINTKRLYYYKITKNKLVSVPVSSTFDSSSSNQAAVDSLLSSPSGLKYSIVGKSSGYSTFAEFNNNSLTYPSPKIRNLNIIECFLLLDFHYVDQEERFKFFQSRHDYLIEQLYYTPEAIIDSSNYNAKIIADHPCKLMVWVTQMEYIKNSKDYYNYTDTYQNKVFKTDEFDCKIGRPVGKSLINSETILMNGNPLMTLRSPVFFDGLQHLEHTKHTPSTGINMYSFGLSPFVTYPTGTLNMSQVSSPEVQLNFSRNVTINNRALFRGYSLCHNILRINSGLAALVFVK